MFVKALGSIVFILSIKHTKSYLASFLKKKSKKLRWKSRGCRLLRSNHRRCSIENSVFKNVKESLFFKAAGLASNFIKFDTPTQFSFCGFCGIFKNTYFEEHLPTATLAPLEKTLVIKTKLLDLLLMLVVALAN